MGRGGSSQLEQSSPGANVGLDIHPQIFVWKEISGPSSTLPPNNTQLCQDTVLGMFSSPALHLLPLALAEVELDEGLG